MQDSSLSRKPSKWIHDIAHGDGLVAFLHVRTKYTFPVRKERFNSLGRNVFGEEDGVAAVEKWLDKIGMKLNLRTLGVEPKYFEDIADCALRTSRGLLSKHPNLLDTPAIVQILKDSY